MFKEKILPKNKEPLLMTPGPVLVPQVIMETFGRPIIHHRTDTFEKDLRNVLDTLPLIFKTKNPVYLHTATGSGAMESAIVNTLSPGDKVLSIVCGKFGERWTEISKAYGLNPIVYNVNWGQCFDIQIIKNYFVEHPDIKAVLCQAVETSTGILNPIQELGAYVSTTNAITIVDAITALAATPLDMDNWNLDVVLGGSQKAFMLPTGLSMISFSKKAWEFIRNSKLPKYYWSIQKEHEANKKNQTFFSSPVSLIQALRTSINLILQIGVNEFIQRHETIAYAVRAYGKTLDLEVFAKAPAPTVTALTLPQNISGEKVQQIMENTYRITIGGGQEHLKGKIIRIGHMGAIEKHHVEMTFEKISETLNQLGHSCNFKCDPNLLRDLKPLPEIL